MISERLLLDLQYNRISIADAIVEALPILKESQPDSVMSWLSDELQGYRHPLDFYYQPRHSFPEYRIVSGSLKLMNREGNIANLEHPLSDRSKYFLSAPVSWLEESNSLPGEYCYTEMPELSHDKTSSEVIVLRYTHKELQNILNEIKRRLVALLK